MSHGNNLRAPAKEEAMIKVYGDILSGNCRKIKFPV